MDECSDLGEVGLYLFGRANVLLKSLIDIITELELIYDSLVDCSGILVAT